MTQFCLEEAAFAYAAKVEQRVSMSLEDEAVGSPVDPVAAGVEDRRRFFASVGEGG